MLELLFKHALIVAILFPFFANAQKGKSLDTSSAPPTLLKVVESDENGKSHSTNKPVQIVDINSSIKVKIDRALLRNQLYQTFGKDSLPEELFARLKLLEKVAKDGAGVMKGFSEALATWSSQSGDEKNLTTLRDKLKPVASGALRVIAIADRGSELRERLNQGLRTLPRGSSVGLQYGLIFTEASNEVNRLNSILDGHLATSGLAVQMGAWLVTKESTTSIHMPGFDTYPEGERFVVDRWNIELSEDQKAQLESISSTAKKLNEGELSALLKEIGSSTPDIFKSLVDEAQKCLVEIEIIAGRLERDVKDGSEAMKERIDTFKSTVTEYRDFLIELEVKYGSEKVDFENDAALLIATNEDLIKLKSNTSKVISDMQANFEETKKVIGSFSSSANGTIQDLQTTLDTCSAKMRTELNGAVQSFQNVVTGITGITKINDDLLVFSDKTKKLSFNDVPTETSFELIRTGKREKGDAVVIKLVGVAASDEEDQRLLDTRTLRLFQVLPHLETIVGLIFANPIGEADTTSTNLSMFQFAASYDILYKWGSRDKIMKNTFFSPGIGINVAALDFNRDWTPELGIGGVFSYFNDLVQVGYGYNLQEAEDYWFFGLRIPLTGVNLAKLGAQ